MASAAGPAVLVVEDEWLIADMVAQAVRDAGYRVLGPVASVAQAQALLARYRCDAALLDLNLGGDRGYALIDQLRARRVPCLLVTGYSRDDLPERYRDHALVGKPAESETLISALAGLLTCRRLRHSAA
ncbi:response regulator [Sphingomonadaceae bacterium OTU29MARTA1]|uniref:response regulator n=1 Tax=Sphingomonas sp. Leaf37 TaxID=2876552 RepID=UPI001E59523E|nr:response regulator [Sphingomonas sp. Leaf37]USU07385.1 response regulator [Sphingomonadaceae bacterium OTU29MARTA1]